MNSWITGSNGSRFGILHPVVSTTKPGLTLWTGLTGTVKGRYDFVSFFKVHLIALSVSQITQSQIWGLLMKNKVGRVWEEAIVASFEILSWIFTLGAEENLGKIQSWEPT
jgi:hypothetical protein